MTLLSFLILSLLLTLEGVVLLWVITGDQSNYLMKISLGYPLGVFLNALLIFLLHILSVPLLPGALTVAHLALLGLLFLLRRCVPASSLFQSEKSNLISGRGRVVVCIALITVITLSAAVSSLSLPFYYWDTFTNWALRGKTLFFHSTLIMDGIRQSQYPILIPGLLLSTMGFGEWSDRSAHAALFLLSLSTLTGIFLLFRAAHGTLPALMTLTLLLGIPLVMIHLRHGYVDVHLTEYALLSLLLLDRAVKMQSGRLLLLSAIFSAACAWTKIEGLYFVCVPWLLCVCTFAWRGSAWKQAISMGVIPLILFVAPWYVYILLLGLTLSPHGLAFAWHQGSIVAILQQLFTFGTFGLHWWVIVIMLVMMLMRERQKIFKQPSLIFGLSTLLFILLTYTFTEDVRGLINGDNFSRVMILPTMVLTAAIATFLSPHVAPEETPSNSPHYIHHDH